MEDEMETVETMELEEKPEKNRSTVLDEFTKLTFGKDKVRIKAGTQIIHHFSSSEANDEELTNSMHRLIRGLGASTINSKIGFLTTLTTLLKHSEYDINENIDRLVKEVQTSGGFSKGENADLLTGQVLFFCALLRSDAINRLSAENCKQIFEKTLMASKKKSYLSLLLTSVLVDSLEMMSKTAFKSIKGLLSCELSKPLEKYTVDELYLLVNLLEKQSKHFDVKFLTKNFSSEKLLTKQNMEKICRILMNVNTYIKNIEDHPVYKTIPQQIGSSSTQMIRKYFHVMDENFVNASPIRHHVLLICHLEVLETYRKSPRFDQSVLVDLMGKHFIQQTLKHFKNTRGSQSPVTFYTYKIFELIIEQFKGSNDTISKLKAIERLTIDPGIFIFEKITASKIVQQIVSTLDGEGVKKLAGIYKGIFLNAKFIVSDRIYAIQLLIKLLEHPAMKKQADYIEWKGEYLIFVVDLALFKNEELLNVTSRLQSTFYSALDAKFSKLNDLAALLSILTGHLHRKIFVCNGAEELRKPLNEKSEEICRKLMKKVEKMRKKSESDQVFHILFLYMFLQMFNDQNKGTEVVEELFVCHEKSSTDEDSAEEDLPWIEVVIDLFLNLLSQDSHSLRTIIKCVFPHLCKHLTKDSIVQMLSVFDPKENVLSDDDDDDESSNDENEDSSDDNEDQSDVNEDQADANEDQADANEDSDSAIEIEEEEDSEDKCTDLKMALQTVLMKSNEHWNEDKDLDEMSEEEGKRLDDALASVLGKYNVSKGKKSAKQPLQDQSLMHFRIRVLDLLDIYLSNEVSVRICLEIMLPLLRTLEFTIRDVHNAPLQNRVRTTLKKLTSVKNFLTPDSGSDAVNEEILQKLLSSLLQKDTMVALLYKDMSDKISECCLFIVKCSQHISTKANLIVATLRKSLDDYFVKGEGFNPIYLFKMIFESNWGESVQFIENLFQYSFDFTIRSFRRCQSLELLRYFYGNTRLLDANREKFVKILRKSESFPKKCVLELFQAPQNFEIREKFLGTLLSVLASMKLCTIQGELKSFDWKSLYDLVILYRSKISISKLTKNDFSKFFSALGMPNKFPITDEPKIKLKGTPIDEESKSENKTHSEAKTTTTKQKTQKEKKRSKQLRQMFSSQGLQGTAFTNFDVDAMDESSPKLSNGLKRSLNKNEDFPEQKAKKVKKSKKRGEQV